MSLRDAIRIGLDNCEIVRMISFGAEGQPWGIEAIGAIASRPADGRADRHRPGRPAPTCNGSGPRSWRRSGPSSSSTGISPRPMSRSGRRRRPSKWSEEILDREQAELLVGRGTVADVAEAPSGSSSSTSIWSTRTSDVITTERQFRKILGSAGGRQPPDRPDHAALRGPFRARLEAMPAGHVRQSAGHRPGETRPDGGRETSGRRPRQGRRVLPAGTRRRTGCPEANGPSSSHRGNPPASRRTGEELGRPIHQRDRQGLRPVPEGDPIGGRRGSAARRPARLLRGGPDHDRRFLDAVCQYATAVATEAQYRATTTSRWSPWKRTRGRSSSPTRSSWPGSRGTGPPIAGQDGRSGTAPLGRRRRCCPPGPARRRQAAGPQPTKTEGTESRCHRQDRLVPPDHRAGPRPIEIRGSFTVAPARRRTTPGPAPVEDRPGPK